MLDNESLAAIEKIVNNAILASEARIKSELNEEIRNEVNASENRMMAYFDETVKKGISVLTDGHKMLGEKLTKLDDLTYCYDELKGSMVAIEAVVVKNRSNIIDLQNAKSN